MKSLFQNNELEAIRLFSHKIHRKKVLVFLQKKLKSNDFFFYFDSERGSNLIVFSTHFDKKTLAAIEIFLLSLPQITADTIEDPLFKNVLQNTLQPIQKIPKVIDISYENDTFDNDFLAFLSKLSNVLIGALRYNDFFIEEKNRLNFAIQLTFLALVRADKKGILEGLDLEFTTTQNWIDDNSPLVSFYEEVQVIESEEKNEKWVIEWLDVSGAFLEKYKFQFLVESIAQVLEIRTYTTQILLMTQFVLKASKPVGVEI